MQLVSRLCLIAFSAALGVAIAYRLSTEAMAVVVGVLMGVLASLPVALLIIYIMRRQAAERDETPAPVARPEPPVAQPMAYAPQGHALPYGGQQPQIVVLPMPQAAMPRGGAMWPQQTMPAPAPRDFYIVGDDE